jgi:hypothetical protein
VATKKTSKRPPSTKKKTAKTAAKKTAKKKASASRSRTKSKPAKEGAATAPDRLDTMASGLASAITAIDSYIGLVENPALQAFYDRTRQTLVRHQARIQGKITRRDAS